MKGNVNMMKENNDNLYIIEDIDKIAFVLNRHKDIISLRKLLKSEKNGYLTIGSLEENGTKKIKVMFLDEKKVNHEFNCELTEFTNSHLMEELVKFVYNLNF